MRFSQLNLVKRYTPPTCILEIYEFAPLMSFLQINSNSSELNFQLHFDDPRLPQEDQSTLKGNLNLLTQLKKQVDHYISKDVIHSGIKPKLSNEDQTSTNQENQTAISLISKGLYHHQLIDNTGAEKKIINLSNTQLFDLANGLAAYDNESDSLFNHHSNFWGKTLPLSIAIVTLLSSFGIVWWWQNRQTAANQNQTDAELALNSEKITPNIEEVIPPSPLDPNNIPAIVSPTETEEMKNRVKLPPPPPTLTQPPILETEMENSLPNPPTPPPITATTPTADRGSITTNSVKILPPPQAPLPPSVSTPPIPYPNDNVIAINPTPPNIPQPSIPQPETFMITTAPPLESAPTFSEPPILRSSDTGTNPNDLVRANNRNQSPAKFSSNNNSLAQEVKQYFQGKWQPPENLTQSIEYRLLVDENGSLAKISPLGQVAQVFLDRTNMPLLGEKITSSSAESQLATIRLILTADGKVQTFQEK